MKPVLESRKKCRTLMYIVQYIYHRHDKIFCFLTSLILLSLASFGLYWFYTLSGSLDRFLEAFFWIKIKKKNWENIKTRFWFFGMYKMNFSFVWNHCFPLVHNTQKHFIIPIRNMTNNTYILLSDIYNSCLFLQV